MKSSFLFAMLASLIIFSCSKNPFQNKDKSSQVTGSMFEGPQVITEMNSALNNGGPYEMTLDDLNTLKAQGAISNSEYEELHNLITSK